MEKLVKGRNGTVLWRVEIHGQAFFILIDGEWCHFNLWGIVCRYSMSKMHK